MKFKSLFFLFSFIGFASFSQITVTDVDVADVGDVIIQAIDTNYSAPFPATGANQTWSFPAGNPSFYDTSIFLDPNNTPYASTYPNSNLVVTADYSEFAYLNKSSTGIMFLGLNDTVSQVPALFLPLPLVYGAQFSDGPHTLLDSVIGEPVVSFILPDSLAPFVSMFQAHTIDSISIKVTQESEFEVDGYGNVTISSGTYDCLRMTQDNYTESDYSVYCTDTINGLGSGWYALGNDIEDETSVQFWSNDPMTKFVVAQLILDSLGNAAEMVYLHNTNTTSIEESIYSIQVYPNPSSGNLYIESVNSSMNMCKIYDVRGNIVEEFNFTNSKILNISTYSNGIYFLDMKSEGNLVRKKIIKQ